MKLHIVGLYGAVCCQNYEGLATNLLACIRLRAIQLGGERPLVARLEPLRAAPSTAKQSLAPRT